MIAQVAGPFDIVGIDPELIYADPDLTPVVNVLSKGVWVDSLSAILVVLDSDSTTAFDLCLLKQDGVLFRIGKRGKQWQGVGWSYDDYPCLATISPDTVSKVLIPSTLELFTETRTLSDVSGFALMSDRYLTFDGNDVIKQTFAGVSSVEKVITTLQPGPGSIFPYNISNGNQLWWLVDRGNGKIYLYDATAKVELSAYRTSFGLSDITMPAYSRKHNWFSCLDSDGKLCIFANERKAYALSDPVVVAPIAGKKSLVYAILTGSNGEACPNRVITFAVNAGTLSMPKVTTNAAGVASTEFDAPFDAIAARTANATLVE